MRAEYFEKSLEEVVGEGKEAGRRKIDVAVEESCRGERKGNVGR